jgi:hypothetical protein
MKNKKLSALICFFGFKIEILILHVYYRMFYFFLDILKLIQLPVETARSEKFSVCSSYAQFAVMADKNSVALRSQQSLARDKEKRNHL